MGTSCIAGAVGRYVLGEERILEAIASFPLAQQTESGMVRKYVQGSSLRADRQSDEYVHHDLQAPGGIVVGAIVVCGLNGD